MRDEKLLEERDGARRRSELQHLPPLDETAERAVEPVGCYTKNTAVTTRSGAVDM